MTASGIPVRRYAAFIPAVALAVLALLGPAVGLSQGGGGQPRVVFEETRADWGIVVQGEAPQHVFRFRNEGTADLHIREVRSSCSCTATILSKGRIPPGGTGELRVTFNSAGRMGYQVSTVTVITNDMKVDDMGPGSARLEFMGEVTTIFQVVPASAIFSAVPRGEAAEIQLRVRMRDGQLVSAADGDWNVLNVEAPRMVQVEQRREGAEVVLVVRVRADAPIGDFRGDLVLTTDHPRQPRLAVPVMATVVGRVLFFPEEVLRRRLDKAEPSLPVITVASRDGKRPLHVLDATVTGDMFNLRTDVVEPDIKTELRLGLKPSAPVGPFAETLTVYLDDPLQPVLRIPIMGELIGRVHLDPAGVWFRAAPGSAEPVASIELTGPVGSYQVTESPPWLRVELGDARDGARTLSVFLSEGVEPGPVQAELVLQGRVVGEETLRIPVRGEVLGKSE